MSLKRGKKAQSIAKRGPLGAHKRPQGAPFGCFGPARGQTAVRLLGHSSVCVAWGCAAALRMPTRSPVCGRAAGFVPGHSFLGWLCVRRRQGGIGPCLHAGPLNSVWHSMCADGGQRRPARGRTAKRSGGHPSRGAARKTRGSLLGAVGACWPCALARLRHQARRG